MASQDVVVTEHEVGEAELAKDTILNMVSEGNPYVFLTAELGQRNGQETLITNVMSVLPPELTKVILENALESVEEFL
jgi:hypothetical protein